MREDVGQHERGYCERYLSFRYFVWFKLFQCAQKLTDVYFSPKCSTRSSCYRHFDSCITQWSCMTSWSKIEGCALFRAQNGRATPFLQTLEDSDAIWDAMSRVISYTALFLLFHFTVAVGEPITGSCNLVFTGTPTGKCGTVCLDLPCQWASHA